MGIEEKSDEYKQHLIELIKLIDTASIEGDVSIWYNGVCCLYRASLGSLGEYKETAKQKFKALQKEQQLFVGNIRKKKRLASSHSFIASQSGSTGTNFIQLLEQFDIDLRETLIDLGVITKKTESTKKEVKTDIKSPIGFGEEKPNAK